MSMNIKKNEQKDNFKIDIKVILNNSIKEDITYNNIEDCFDEQSLEDWYDFALNIEGVLDRNFLVKNISINKSKNRLFESIDFCRKDNKGLINLSLSNVNNTDNIIENNDSNNKIFSINLNGKQFDSYNSTLKHIEVLLNKLYESTSDIQKIINNTEKYCNKRWNEILDSMIFLFDECDDAKSSMQNNYDITVDFDGYKKRQDEIEKYQNKCKKEALKMFCEYFDYLWN